MICLCFLKYDFESEVIDGKPMEDIIDQYKSNMQTLDNKSIKALFFGFYMIREMNTDLVKKITFTDGSKLNDKQIETANKRFRVHENEQTTVYDKESYKDVLTKIKRHFFTFKIIEMNGKKIFEVTNEEKKFIKKNGSVIKELETLCDKFFKENCAEYIRKKNFSISGEKEESWSSIELNLARYSKFVL
ncbi:hypothetical protein P3W45_001646 [Vairimorpha bombi]